MKIHKINSIDSTNTYLKDWCRKEQLGNFTVVIADEQTAGRGQRTNKWHSEKGKNLTFSMLIRLSNFDVSRQFELNQAISLGLIMALKKYIVTSDFSIKIKWPNDIFVNKKKIAGILVENTLNTSKIKQSIVGVGLNVNQMSFPKTLPDADSLQLIIGKHIDLEILLYEIITAIKTYCTKLEQNQSLQQEYLQNLYLLGVVSTFKDKDNNEFTGEIIGVKANGKLEIKRQNQMLSTFCFKEISFIN